jgi:hypothetical protein
MTKDTIIHRFDAGGDRSLVCFLSPLHLGDQFNVYLPAKGVPANVAQVLAAVAPRGREGFDAGQVAADFVAALKPAVRAKLVGTGRVVPDSLRHTDYRVLVSRGTVGHTHARLLSVVNGVEAAESLYDGSLTNFVAWAEKLTGLEGVVKKVVKFRYNGGTVVGGERLVRVEEVQRVDNVVHLCGYDLRKPDMKLAFRRYSSDKIEGNIEVVA